MPFILGALAVLAAVYFFFVRARDSAEMAHDVLDVANDVRLAARRFGYKWKNRGHPVDAVESIEVAAAGVAEAFITLDDLPSKEERIAVLRQLQTTYRIDLTAAEEASALGRWLVSQCGEPEQGLWRLAKKVHALGGTEAILGLMEVLGETAKATGTLGPKQRDALVDLPQRYAG